MGLQDFPKGRVETRDTKLNAVGGGGGGVLSTLGPTRKAGTGGGGVCCPLQARYSLVPRPRFPTAAGGLHHRYVESGSGK